MGASYVRRFMFDPGNDVLLEIESVNILDLDPPAPITGIGVGTIILVGEFENGPYATPTEVVGASDLLANFGSLGYLYGGVVGNNPCARARKADSALVAEPWNGNGFVQLSGKKFARLIICRVNTSVGQVQFTALPFIVGGNSFRFGLTTGQVLSVTTTSGTSSATFTGTPATVTAVGGVYPTTFAGGETLTLGRDDQPNFTVTFLSTDQSLAQTLARINQYAGFTFADSTGGQLRFTGLQGGSGGQVRVVSGSTGVLTKLGLTAANTAGAGNVVNIAAVTPAEIDTVLHAAAATVNVEQLADGSLRMKTTEALLTIAAGTTAAALGFTIGASATAAPVSGIIPAGTVVQQTGGTPQVLVTTQDVVVTAGTAGPYNAYVRHATDDGTGLSTLAGSITVIPNAIALGAFSVINGQVTTAALAEAAIDAAYVDAINATEDMNSVAKVANGIWSARQSNLIRSTLRVDARNTSGQGMYGRIAAVRPPLNTPKATALSSAGNPGVGATRDERVIYCYPAANTTVPLIAKRGLAGGASFTATGAVDVGSDGFLMSIISQLPPEENPGQETGFTGGINSVETGVNAQRFLMGDYKNFKAAGICALRVDDGVAIFQSGVTSVNPGTDPGRVNIARRRMADYIEDTLARAAMKYGKKLNTFTRRKNITLEIRQWLKALADSERIEDWDVDEKSLNKDPAVVGKGLWKLKISVRTFSSLDSIVLACTIGETVTIEKLAA